MKLNYYLSNKAGKDGQTAILIYVHIDGKRIIKTSKQKVVSEYWDKDRQRAKSSFKFSAELNDHLSKLQDDIYKSIKSLESEGVLDVENVKKHIDEIVKGERISEAKQEGEGFFYWLDKFIELRASGQDKTNRGHQVGEGAIKKYRTFRWHLNGFMSYSNYEISFESINQQFFDEYIDYLLKVKELGLNTVGKQIGTLKAYLNWAVSKGVNKNLDFKGFKKINEETDHVYLSTGEITRLFDLDLSKNIRLERVRDLFVIGCITALGLSDYKRISCDSIKNGKIHIVLKKSNEPVAIPLHPFVKQILSKYESALPSVSDQKFNGYLKELGRLAGLEEEVQVRSSKGGVRKVLTKKKWELIISDTARRSGAINMYKAGLPILAIMKITGHRTETGFLKYINVTNEEDVGMLANHPYFNPLAKRKKNGEITYSW
ncbi:phage integrase SAM-like domain-containing protein [Flammeovirgaceae bacterium SG7u.111]|nr:phage integrase SAM-like domain-containing protein [Flammeovirgaceae bacterium SG7u.132]WPO35707.1 phage integrase SAM-like domain-containing protein [Flammeovirgaceae bacterium SG7u.111]